MKRKPTRFIAAFVSLGLVAVLTLGMAACSSSATTKSTATLVSISVTPYSPANLAVGSTQRFAATGIYSDGTTPNITAQVTWTSSNSSIAGIATGLATGVAVGSTSITASESGITSPAVTLTVITSTSGLSSIAVTPAFPADLGVGASLQLSAVGTYADGTTADITSKVTWTTSNTAAAVVFANGAVTGEGTGTTNITAALSGVTSSGLKLTVKAVSSILITPAASPRNLDVGATQQFTAVATYSDGASADVSSQVTWLSSNTQVATIYANGLATGIAAGSAGITATLGGVTSMATELAVQHLSSIAISPASPNNLAVGATQHFTAIGTFADGSLMDITSQVTWFSATANIATIAAGGAATGVKTGTDKITAALAGITSQPVALNVIALSAISVTPSSPANMGVGATQHFTATGSYSDGSTADFTSQVVWFSSNSTVVTIASGGIATAVGGGTANITVTFGGLTSQPVTLMVKVLSAIMIEPATTPRNVNVGASLPFIAVGIFSDGSMSDITSQVIWISSNTNIATVLTSNSAANSNTSATGVAAGTAIITATLSGITSQPITLNVVSP
jgi:trimeric autotransporter adhesin